MSDEKQRRQREQAEILAAQKELIKRMMSDEKPGPKGLFGAWVRAMEREAGKKSLTPDAINKANGGDK
tara:strand:- start:186 stop:389 length:204 start_codon:yes stop_codon:yes gene_type:complete